MKIFGARSKWFFVTGLLIGFMAMMLISGLGIGIPSVTPALAEEEKPTASLGVDIFSQYVWRGFALSRDSAVFQPSLTVGYKGFAVNVWGNFDTHENNPFIPPSDSAKWNETDFTASYSRDLYSGTAIKTVSGTIGVIYYALDRINSPQGDSFEIFYGLSADVNWFTFAITANQEVFHYPGWWLNLGISRVFELPYKIQNNSNLSVEVGHNFLFLFSRDQVAYPDLSTTNQAFNGPLTGQFYATLNIPVHKYVTISPKIGFWYAAGGNSTSLLAAGSWDSQQNHVYGGVNATFAF
jgi:hypothetical protein